MAKTATPRDRAEPETKSVFGRFFRSVAETSGVFVHVLGVMLYRWVLYPNRTPNRETIAALREMDAGIGVTKYASWEDFERELDDA